MDKSCKLDLIRSTGLIAIIRTRSSEQLMSAAEAILRGGVRVIEVSMTTPDALKVIDEIVKKSNGEMLFGAGTILDVNAAYAAISAGAGFIVSPILDLDVIALCNRYSIPIIPGCFTPTEIMRAWEAGADMIKLFPAGYGGPSLLKAILAPLPQVEVVPVGGVNLKNAAEFIKNGATALGIGSEIINDELLNKNGLNEITQRTNAFIQEVKKGRGEINQ